MHEKELRKRKVKKVCQACGWKAKTMYARKCKSCGEKLSRMHYVKMKDGTVYTVAETEDE